MHYYLPTIGQQTAFTAHPNNEENSISIPLHTTMHHRRAQTASPFHKAKHQQSILKEIKSVQQLNAMPPSPTPNHPSSTPNHPRSTPTHPRSTHCDSHLSLSAQLRHIQQLRKKENKKQFSFAVDQEKVCREGWQEFGEKAERGTQEGLERVRRKARQMKKRMTVSSIWERTGRGSAAQGAAVGEERVADLWGLVRGERVREDGWARMGQLAQDVKESVFLGNCYQLCVESLEEGQEASLRGQKLKCLAYLTEKGHKLPKKSLDWLMTQNYFLP